MSHQTSPFKRPWAIELGRVKARKEGAKGHYVAHFQRNGRHEKRSLKTARLEAAMSAAVQLEHQLQVGTFQPQPPNKTIAEACVEFCKSRLSDGCKPKTLAKYTTELEFFAKTLADAGVVHLRQLTEASLEDYRDLRRKTNLRGDEMTLSEKSLHAACMNIKSFSRWCTDRRGYLARNPFAHVGVVKPPLVKQPAATLEQIEAILKIADLPLRTHIAFLAFSGARSGEMALMCRKDIDLRGNWIFIPTLKRKKTEIITRRKVPLHPRLKTFLEEYVAAYPTRPDDYLFQAVPSQKFPTGGHGINTKHLCDRFEKLALALGYTVGRKNYGLVIHSLRHFFETFTTNNAVPQRVVDTWLAHAGDRSMGALYYDLNDADSQHFMAKVPF